jgi:hypothetical protein
MHTALILKEQMKVEGEYTKKLYKIKNISDVRSDIKGVERKIIYADRGHGLEFNSPL